MIFTIHIKYFDVKSHTRILMLINPLRESLSLWRKATAPGSIDISIRVFDITGGLPSLYSRESAFSLFEERDPFPAPRPPKGCALGS